MSVQPIREGDYAPDFSLNDHNGKKIKLSDFRGRRVVVYFYPKDFTPGCSTEASEFAGDYEKFKTENIEIIGVSADDVKSHLEFKEKMNIPYILVSDTDNNISKKYAVYGPRAFMGKEYMGIKRTTFLLDQRGIVIKVFNKVKPLGHSHEVLEKFK